MEHGQENVKWLWKEAQDQEQALISQHPQEKGRDQLGSSDSLCMTQSLLLQPPAPGPSCKLPKARRVLPSGMFWQAQDGPHKTSGQGPAPSWGWEPYPRLTDILLSTLESSWPAVHTNVVPGG